MPTIDHEGFPKNYKPGPQFPVSPSDKEFEKIVPGHVSGPEEIENINDPDRLRLIIDQMERILDPTTDPKGPFYNVPSGLASSDISSEGAQEKIKEEYLAKARKILEAAKARLSQISH